RRGGQPAARTGSGARRPARDPRLLRQRVTVFVVVTLLVALGIAVAQGCQGPDRRTDGLQRPGVSQPREGGGPAESGARTAVRTR
ncbi:serine/threonine protein kinase, partial [Streptosporangium nondiastaticum]